MGTSKSVADEEKAIYSPRQEERPDNRKDVLSQNQVAITVVEDMERSPIQVSHSHVETFRCSRRLDAWMQNAKKTTGKCRGTGTPNCFRVQWTISRSSDHRPSEV